MSQWRWGKLALPETDTADSVALELARELAAMMTSTHQDSVIGPDGAVYDIELAVRLIPVEQPTVN